MESLTWGRAAGHELRARGHEVIFGYGGPFPELLEQEGFQAEPVAGDIARP